MRQALRFSTSLAALVIAGAAVPAYAQAIDPPAVDDPDQIVVTATKREENLQDVPITISVLTADDIADQGIDRPSDFLTGIPNVTFIEDNAGEVYVNIRGQTSVRNSDPNVAVVIDGVTLSSLKSFNLGPIEQNLDLGRDERLVGELAQMDVAGRVHRDHRRHLGHRVELAQ